MLRSRCGSFCGGTGPAQMYIKAVGGYSSSIGFSEIRNEVDFRLCLDSCSH
jgi:hypothetical protein